MVSLCLVCCCDVCLFVQDRSVPLPLSCLSGRGVRFIRTLPWSELRHRLPISVVVERHVFVWPADKDFGLFFWDEETKKGFWLEPGRTLEYYLLKSEVSSPHCMRFYQCILT